MRRNVGSPPGLSVENVVPFFTFFNLTNAMYDSELCQCIERMGSISQALCSIEASLNMAATAARWGLMQGKTREVLLSVGEL